MRLTAATKLKKSDDYIPELYTPFFRRFTDERARDIGETVALYNSVRARYFSSPYSHDKAIHNLVREVEKVAV